MLQLENILIERDQRSILEVEQLNIASDDFTLILGHNGSGKSTLASVMAGQIPADSGNIYLNNQPLNKFKASDLAKHIGYLPQYLPQAPGLTVKELVKLGRFPWRGMLGRWRIEDQKIIEAAIQHTDCTAFTDTLVDQLSGGERHRAWISMLLAQQAKLLILDEPTAALDIAHQYALLSLLKKLHLEQGIGVVMVLHDINLALRFASQILAMHKGKLFFQGSAKQFSDAKLLSQLFAIDIKLQEHPHDLHKVAVVC
jgi:iron complex transport system ATP-binding protein